MWQYTDDEEQVPPAIRPLWREYRRARKLFDDAKRDMRQIEAEVREARQACAHPMDQREKHRGGGGGLGGDHWISCSHCGGGLSVKRGTITLEDWKAHPGKVQYHSTGN